MVWLDKNPDAAEILNRGWRHLLRTPFESWDMQEFWGKFGYVQNNPSLEFVKGFIVSAVEVWDTVRDQVEG